MSESGVLTLGSIGSRLDLELRAGDTIGPYTFVFTNEAGAPINLTGASFSAAISLIDGRVTTDINITTAITDAVNGKASLTLSAALTAGFDASLVADADFAKTKKLYAWKSSYVDSLGSKHTVFFGYVWIAAKTLP